MFLNTFPNFAILPAPVNVAISKISSGINVITLIPYVVRVLFGPLHRWMFRPSVMSKSRNLFNFFQGISIGIWKFGWRKRLCISIKTYLVSEKSLSIAIGNFDLKKSFDLSIRKFRHEVFSVTNVECSILYSYQRIRSQKGSVLVLDNLVTNQKSRSGYWKICSKV